VCSGVVRVHELSLAYTPLESLKKKINKLVDHKYFQTGVEVGQVVDRDMDGSAIHWPRRKGLHD
jgi:hypothetical protein